MARRAISLRHRSPTRPSREESRDGVLARVRPLAVDTCAHRPMHTALRGRFRPLRRGLESRCGRFRTPWVRIPPPPPTLQAGSRPICTPRKSRRRWFNAGQRNPPRERFRSPTFPERWRRLRATRQESRARVAKQTCGVALGRPPSPTLGRLHAPRLRWRWGGERHGSIDRPEWRISRHGAVR